MGITSALYSGVSGLNSDSQAMSVIGNNLANTGTTGFKGASTVFSDLLSSTIYGSGGLSQVGRGVNVSKVKNDFSQGTFQSTNSGTDVAIEGSGFFILKKVGDLTNYYSRAGSFNFDADGYLVNPEGLRVQGQQYDTSGNLIPGDPSDIKVNTQNLQAANTTTTLTLNTNLDASSTEIPAATAFDYTDPTTFNYSSSAEVFDSLGNSHLMTIYFRKEVSPPTNTWDWYWSAEDATGTVLGNGGDPNSSAGTITFNNDGSLASGGTATISSGDLAWANGSDSSDIATTFNTTQYNSDSVIISKAQDGYGAGNLTDISIDSQGIVTASYSNGVQNKIANISLAKFANPQGLEQEGNNLYLATTDSGSPRAGLPGTELGKIFTNSLEQSNVDMGAEFVTMITIQRAFQASSKIITTVDQLLNDVINLKQ